MSGRVATKINVAMERIALISAVLLPLTAIASIYGLNVIVSDATQPVTRLRSSASWSASHCSSSDGPTARAGGNRSAASRRGNACPYSNRLTRVRAIRNARSTR